MGSDGLRPPRQKDVVGQLPAASPEGVHHGADRRIGQAGQQRPPRLHPLLSRFVLRVLVIEGTDEGKPVRLPGHAREQLRDPDARDVRRYGLVGPADLGRSLRLDVPGVQLRGAADEQEKDAARLVAGVDGAERTERGEIGKGQAKTCE